MKTGFSKICITPPDGTLMRGYYEKRESKGVLDDLYVSSVAFDDGERKALVISVDVCVLSVEQSDKIREDISKKTGIDKDAVFITCSHTHTGPAIDFDTSGEMTDGKYEKIFYELVIRSAENSLANVCESKFFAGDGVAEGISFIRRFRMKDGGVQTNPGVDNPNISHPLGTANDSVKFLKIEREGAENIVLVNFGTHADTVGGEYISGDWPSILCKTVEAVFDNTKCVFLTGAQGDVNHINISPSDSDRIGLDYDSFDGVPRGYEHTKYMGRRIAAAIIGALDKACPFSADRISYSTKEISIPSNREMHKLDEAKRIVNLHAQGRDNELPYEKMELTTIVAEAIRICELEKGPDAFDFTLGALKIGDYVIASVPGECFVEIGRRIEANYDDKHIMVCGLTNGGDSYFPTSSAYDEGGYEARSSCLKKGGDNILVEGMKELISKLN